MQRELAQLIGALKEGTSLSAVAALIGGSFLYGLFHAAGPGHGKVVISSYLLGGKTRLKSGLWLTLVSSLAQGVTAVLFVGILALVLGRAGTAVTRDVRVLELVSYGLVVAMGCVMLWRALRTGSTCAHDHHHHTSGHDHHHHDHSLPRRDFGALILAIGIRPCTGAVIVLLVTFSNGLWWVGIASTFAMALGTALCVGALALLAVGARDFASKLAVQRGGKLERLVTRGLAIVGSLLVIGLGALFMSLAFEAPSL